jgi:hypothetical protein
MDCVRQGVPGERELLCHRARQLRSVSRDAADEDELADPVVLITIRLGDGLHDARSAGDINLPHAVQIKYAGSHRVEHEGEMYHCDRPKLAE